LAGSSSVPRALHFLIAPHLAARWRSRRQDRYFLPESGAKRFNFAQRWVTSDRKAWLL
jgi:hypothetical protein